jgi:ATP-dependent Clp protease, protease subunit
MPKKIIVIDGYIGPFGYSKQFVRQMLKGTEKDDVEIQTSSLGGSVDDALDIHDQIATHGNVTISYTGFNASSATLFSLGASKIRISENSFYLIHKVMSWVDEFGLMNEDDLDVLITRLEKEKNENAKITLQIAQMYAKKTGKSAREILDLMKQETWLTAEEAKTMGFVDEIFTPGTKENFLEDSVKVALIAAAGFPLPKRKENNIETPSVGDEEKFFNKMLTRLKQALNTNKEPMKKQFLNVNKALKVEKLESTEDGVFLNEEQLETIDLCITAAVAATTERDTAKTECNIAKTALTNALTAFDAIDPSVATAKTVEAKVQAIQAVIAKKPGANSAHIDTETDGGAGGEGGETFWDRFHNLKKK